MDTAATPSSKDLMPDNTKMRHAVFLLPFFFPQLGLGRNLGGTVANMDTASPLLCLDFPNGSVEVQGTQGDVALPEKSFMVVIAAIAKK